MTQRQLRAHSAAERRIRQRRIRQRSGHISEWLAAAFLMTKGYRILALRRKTSAGEIDLIAVRGKRLAFIEVKRRSTLEQAEASLAPRQQSRIHNAALLWIARQPRYQTHEICFDAVFIVPRHWPVHLENGL